VVKKRGNARFFQQTNQGITNPEYGTVVDNTVTRAEWYDFYLISQSTTQGTVNPTHYNVIHDTSGLLPEHLQKLSHKLTHMYYNWPVTLLNDSL
jgi:aubergine-like protein